MYFRGVHDIFRLFPVLLLDFLLSQCFMGLSNINILLAIPVIIHHPPEYLCLFRKEKKSSQIPNTPMFFGWNTLTPSKAPHQHIVGITSVDSVRAARNAPDRWESHVANGWNRSPWHPQLLSRCHAKVSRSLQSVQNWPLTEWWF